MSVVIAIGPSSFAQASTIPRDLLETSGVTIVPNPLGRRLTEEEIILHLKDVDGLIAGLEPLNRHVLESTHRLRSIARVGVGTENIDQQAANELGIKVSNTPDGPTQAVAEILSLLCFLYADTFYLLMLLYIKKNG